MLPCPRRNGAVILQHQVCLAGYLLSEVVISFLVLLTARFRIKKKQKTVNLERSVSDLTGRAEELEKEVADLRRENGWLKEIVMLKGTRIASANMAHRMALNQAAAMVGPQASGSGTAPSGSSSGQNDEESEEESDSSDDDTVAKGKGKPDSSATRRK